MSAEVHIAGVLIQARPEALPTVRDAVSHIPLAEITHAGADGRAVAVLEAPTARTVASQIDAIRAIHGVLDVALVYQHAEPEQDIDKEIQA